MKKMTLTLTGLIWVLLSSCNEEFVDPSLVTKLSIAASTYNATYEIKIGRPANDLPSTEKYATIYVLDGEENFNLVTNHCRKVATSYGVDNVLVVSIGYGRDRNMDYTPTTTNEMGGAPQFLKFIKDELIPKIEQEFSADTARFSRVILGHSFGGLFGTYAFGADNNLFGNYILLSPSLWYDNEITLRLESAQRNVNKNKQQLVFMGIGELENAGRMQAPFDGLYKILKEDYQNIKIKMNREKDLDHKGSENPNILKGLDFYFQNR